MQALTITAVDVSDVRFPTSASGVGSDAMNPDPDYSAAYVTIRTSRDGLNGYGLTFTIGRGTEVCVAAVRALSPLLVGQRVDDLLADMAGFWRRLACDTQLRWIGPEKGVIHLATAAVVNAVWDLWARLVDKPLWKLLADLSAEELIGCIDFRYLADALTPTEAIELLRQNDRDRGEREAHVAAVGFPAYTTSVGWIGYSDDDVRRLCREAMAAGWKDVKIKVGGSLADDVRRLEIVRAEIGPDCRMMLDANQRWDVPEAIEWMKALARFDPFWIEEPTSPDDVLGHAAIARAVAPIRVATGEHVHNRVMYKQFLQSGAMGICQVDTCRLGGVNETIAVLLLAAKYGVPVCPHSGGVGLSEYGQHLSIFDYVRVGASMDDRMLEYVDHLHEHFVDPVAVKGGRYLVPTAVGASVEMWPDSIADYSFPEGPRHAAR